ncbi:ABC transporter ATP-binding protein [Mesorhizobium sp. VK25A]|uniref:Spermidine/putrescine import ATP-binding protein PotA n=1 Tax=Mesorhizobium vachelliae TaxID=3072309 RepID=A0ABU5A5Y2_9HYPH|nr:MULTISPECIES: ABC transporter ATP-binding protein [unclassified Mesorhizobium]MDX8533084.1 ABC transporter ATP-binding protein [Mesorhizobium sp. VK25D]MDX8545003.1 ABC transporter ATP-binding protein [Mesorhizobium sp. VK25A]
MAQPSTTALPVQLQSLSKFYGAVHAVEDVSFDIKAGEFLTLLGPSGSGKTTLLMMIAGFNRPTKGSIRIGGQEIVHLPPHKRNIGMVFQNYALFPHMSVGENIAYPLRLRKIGRAEVEDRVRKALDLVQLGGYADRRTSELSGGQRQRVALARAIIFEPRILLMDEPLSALDKQLRETMQIEIRKLHDRLGMTTISVTHDQREALTMSDRIAVFSKGRLAQVATPTCLYDQPQSQFIAEFIGESSFLPLRKASGGLAYGGQVIQFAETSPDTFDKPMLMLRPERLHLCALEEANKGADGNIFDGQVQTVVFQGDSLLYEVVLSEGHRVVVRVPNRSDDLRRMPQAGNRVALRLDRADTRIVRAEG